MMALAATLLEEKSYDLARARVAEALEQYKWAADELDRLGSGCSLAFFERTTGAALRFKYKVLRAEFKEATERHAAELQELKQEREQGPKGEPGPEAGATLPGLVQGL